MEECDQMMGTALSAYEGAGIPVQPEKVEAGTPLHQAAAEYGAPFDDLVIGMFRSADASGKMDEVLAGQQAGFAELRSELAQLRGAAHVPLRAAEELTWARVEAGRRRRSASRLI